MQDITDTFSAYSQSFSLASRFNLYPYLWISGIISFIIGAIIFWSGYAFSDDIGNWIENLYPWEWGSKVFAGIINWISGGLIVVLGLFLYKYFILIAVSPIMGPLSEKLEEGLLDKSDGIKFSFSRMTKEMIRGIFISLRNILRELFYTILLLICSIIPGIAFVSAPGIYLVQAYYAGFGNLDYYMERHFTIKESARIVKRHKGIAIANGGVFLVLLMIPVLGWFLAPFMATIAGTKVLCDKVNIAEYV